MGAVAKYSDEHVCVSVCLSVCDDISRTTRTILTYFCACCLWPFSGRVTKSQGQFWGFPHWQCIEQHSIWYPYKNDWTDRDAVWDDEWAYLTWGTVCYVGWRSLKGKRHFFWGGTCRQA